MKSTKEDPAKALKEKVLQLEMEQIISVHTFHYLLKEIL